MRLYSRAELRPWRRQLRDSLRSARAAVAKASESLSPGQVSGLVEEWATLLGHRVGRVVGTSILNRVLAQRGLTATSAEPPALASLLEGLVETASVFLSEEENDAFAAALARAAKERAKEERER